MPTAVTLADRPDLVEAVRGFDDGLPGFMRNDPCGWQFASLPDAFPQYQLALLDDGGALLGFGYCGPIPWDGDPATLPDQGWDEGLGRCSRAHLSPRPTPAVCAFEIGIDPRARGRGLSALLVSAMRDNARRLGHSDLVAPVRPNAKHREPRTPMQEYAFRVRNDGLPFDPWLRVHARLGGEILKVCPAAMAIAGSLAQWRSWTGLPFDGDGELEAGLTCSGCIPGPRWRTRLEQPVEEE